MRIRTAWIMAAAAGLACAALARAENPPAGDSGVAAAPNASTRLAVAGPRGVVSSGMMVDDRSGQALGTVAEVVRDKSEQRYVLVKGMNGRITPVPYDAASSMTAAGKVVLDRAAFEQAPKIGQNEVSSGSARWQSKVNRYWRKHAAG